MIIIIILVVWQCKRNFLWQFWNYFENCLLSIWIFKSSFLIYIYLLVWIFASFLKDLPLFRLLKPRLINCLVIFDYFHQSIISRLILNFLLLSQWHVSDLTLWGHMFISLNYVFILGFLFNRVCMNFLSIYRVASSYSFSLSVIYLHSLYKWRFTWIEI